MNTWEFAGTLALFLGISAAMGGALVMLGFLLGRLAPPLEDEKSKREVSR